MERHPRRISSFFQSPEQRPPAALSGTAKDDRRPPWTLCISLLAFYLAACGGEPLVVDAPEGEDGGFSAAVQCSETQPCPNGMTCSQSMCVNASPGFTGNDSTGTDGGSLCDNIPNAPGCIDVFSRLDAGSINDSQVPDARQLPDTTVTINDTGPDVPPAEDECTPPGTANACSETDAILDGCRIDESTKGAVCIGSTNFSPIGAPCLSHESCDLLLGCHFGMCVPYCNLGFGTLVSGGICPAQTPTCKSVGHPTFGACAPQ